MTEANGQDLPQPSTYCELVSDLPPGFMLIGRLSGSHPIDLLAKAASRLQRESTEPSIR